MAENEAIEELREQIETAEFMISFNMNFELKHDNSVLENKIKTAKIAISALEEIQQYRAIGTVEECREAGERRIPKIPEIWGDGYDNEGNMIYDMYDCPNCGKSYEADYLDYKYCPECGQAIDRSDLDKLVRIGAVV